MKKSLAFALILAMLITVMPIATVAAFADEEPVTIRFMRFEHAASPLTNDSIVLNELRKRLGVDIQLEAVAGDYNTKKSVLLGSNSMTDVMMLTDTDVFKYARTGMFENLTPHLDAGELPNYQAFIDTDSNIQLLKVDGGLYGFINGNKIISDDVDVKEGAHNGFMPVIRVDLLEKHDIPTPTTWDELADALRKLKEIYPDSKPWTARGNILSTFPFAYGSGSGTYFEPNENRWKNGCLYEEREEALKFLAGLYAEGILDPDIFSCSQAQWIENMGSGKSFFYYDNPNFGLEMNTALKGIEPDAEIFVLKQLKNPYGQARAFEYTPNFYDRQWVVSVDLDDHKKAEALRVLDYLYSDEGIILTTYGIEGETYTTDDAGQRHYLESALDEVFTDGVYNYYKLSSAWGVDCEAFGACWASEDRVADTKYYDENSYNERQNRLTMEDSDSWIKPVLNPPFTEEEQERMAEITERVNLIYTPFATKVVLGEESFDNWDAMVEQCRAAGSEEIEQIYNTAYERAMSK